MSIVQGVNINVCLLKEFQLSVQGIEGLPDNITLGLHRTNTTSVVGVKQTKSVKSENNKKKQSRRVSVQSHTISEADVNIGYTGIDMKRELQIRFGKLEAAEISVQVCVFIKKNNRTIKQSNKI